MHVSAFYAEYASSVHLGTFRSVDIRIYITRSILLSPRDVVQYIYFTFATHLFKYHFCICEADIYAIANVPYRTVYIAIQRRAYII